MPAAHRPQPALTAVDAMAATAITTWFARDRLAGLADRLAIAVAVSLPWSTSLTGILIVLWLAALVPALDRASVRRALAHPAGGLPVALWAFVVIGMLWADVSWAERAAALRGAHKLLMIPLLLVQFRRSDKGPWVLAGFLASCTVIASRRPILSLRCMRLPRARTSYRRTYVPVPDGSTTSLRPLSLPIWYSVSLPSFAMAAFTAWTFSGRTRVAVSAISLTLP
jgi:hypothetical protein